MKKDCNDECGYIIFTRIVVGMILLGLLGSIITWGCTVSSRLESLECSVKDNHTNVYSTINLLAEGIGYTRKYIERNKGTDDSYYKEAYVKD